MTTDTDILPSQLPSTVRTFLSAHAAGDTAGAVRQLADTAVVVDQGETFRGTDRVLDFLRHAGSEFTYTTELVGARRADARHWVAVVRLEGDFPGAVAVLNYRFTVEDDRIVELVIGV